MAAMSGGVDSSVAAFLLKEKGYEVVGLTMCLGIKDVGQDSPRCCGAKAIEDAKRVCDKIGIPHYVMDFSKDLEEKVIGKFVDEYLRGRTPNPCVECNRFIKFGALLEKALSLGFDYLATGHYARIEIRDDKYFLKRPKDRVKDQTYFLYPIKYNYLGSILFPLSSLTKEEVRRIARDVNLPVADKPQSQDICFIPKRDYRRFIMERIKEIKPGPILDLQGNVLGEHKGIIFYTVGQREGLGISYKSPLYVIDIDEQRNAIIAGERQYLRAKGLIAGDLSLFCEVFPQTVDAKIRYNHKESPCRIVSSNSKVEAVFEEEQEAVTPGQSVVFYNKDTVLGGGIIEKVLR